MKRYKTADAIKRNLKVQWEQACNAYLLELSKMWELDYDLTPNGYGYWIADIVGDVYDYGGMITINMQDIIFCVENDVSKDTYFEYTEYCLKCSEYNFPHPTFQAFAKGCPLIPQERFDRLEALQKDLDDYAKETRKLF